MIDYIASDMSNLLRKVHILLVSDFQVIAFFIPLEVGYLFIIVVNFELRKSTTITLGTSQNNV